jgi:hypothetical protein
VDALVLELPGIHIQEEEAKEIVGNTYTLMQAMVIAHQHLTPAVTQHMRTVCHTSL